MNIENKREPRIILLYSPQRFDRRFGAVKPEGSLGITYLAGALRADEFDVEVLDCSVGNMNYTLEETFFKETTLPDGKIRIGMSMSDIIKEVRHFDIIGLSSIFTAQTRMVQDVVRALRIAYPEKLIVLGGVNARVQMPLFFEAGASIICLSESERTIVQICEKFRYGLSDFSDIGGIAYVHDDKIVTSCTSNVEQDLDRLPIPAWDMLPLQKYWKIARPHGGGFSSEHPIPYASLMTSRGCPFKCEFCHVGMELEGSLSGNIRKLRQKSLERVMQEMHILKGLGVIHVFLEDDALLAKRDRALSIFNAISELKMELSGVNGVNLAHLNKSEKGRIVVDEELFEAIARAGMKKMTFPFESGSQRLINQFATNKLDLEKHNLVALIRKAKSLGMEVTGNYMVGYPGETMADIRATIALARKHRQEGLDNANLAIITPFPGTKFYEMVVANNMFLPDVNICDLDWMYPSIKTDIPPKVLVSVITKGWRLLNDPKRVNRIRSMAPSVSV